jgi:DNA-dependent RNA polymerase auxiliary subunit epsilon
MPDVARKTPDRSHTQSVIFNKADWTEANARRWLKERDFYVDGLDETETSFRFRQFNPDPGRFTYRTVNNNMDAFKGLPNGVSLVQAIPK